MPASMTANRSGLTAIITFLVAFSAPERSWGGHDEAKALRDADVIVPLERITRQAAAQYPGHLLDVELEHSAERYTYEVEWLGDNGRMQELWFDARTGEPVGNAEDRDDRAQP